MAEEKDQTPTLNSDDINVLRVLLHNIKGISSVSTISEFAQYDELADEATEQNR